MTYEYILPALFLILSNLIKVSATSTKNPFDTFYDFLSGLPVDLTFVATSVIFLSSGGLNTASLTSAFICFIVGALQCAFIYKTQILFYDAKKILCSYLFLLLNVITTLIVYYTIFFYEVRL